MMKRHFLWLVLYLMVMLTAAAPAHAELVVIASAGSRIGPLSRQEIINIYMGRYCKLKNDVIAMPLDIDMDSPERRNFYLHLLDKTLAEINAYWARLVFSGKTAAPEELASQREILDRVARDPNAIGYVDRRNLNAHVKVVYEFKD